MLYKAKPKEGDDMANINELKGFLDEKGVKPSYPRLRILGYLMELRNHPTAEEIYEALVPEMPTLSRTTVYNTLNLFVEEGVVIPVHINSNETRFDAIVEAHGHFKCHVCGKLIDFPIDMGDCGIRELNGYKITARSVTFKGICQECLNQ